MVMVLLQKLNYSQCLPNQKSYNTNLTIKRHTAAQGWECGLSDKLHLKQYNIMKSIDIVKKLERKGYEINYMLSGGVVVKKGQMRNFYRSLNFAYNSLLK